MELFGYSERGLVNALSYDLLNCQCGEMLLATMLGKTCFPLLEENPFSEGRGLRKATLLVEQSLSQFGDCDLIILCEYGDGAKAVVFCEFKRGIRWTLRNEWTQFTIRVENKIREKLTSNLFCQLYFKQRFVDALNNPLNESINNGLIFDELLDIRSGTGHRKIGENQTVLKAVELIRDFAKNSYFLMVTPQNNESNELGIFLKEVNEQHNGIANWSIKRWGHLSLPTIRTFCEENKPHFNHSLSVFDYNRYQI